MGDRPIPLRRTFPSSWSEAAAFGFGLALAGVYASGLVAGGLPKWLVLYLAAALACAVLRPALDTLGWLVLAFVGYAALSLSWSPDPGGGLTGLLKLGVLTAIFFAARAYSDRWRLDILVPAMLATALVLAAIERSYYGGFGNENFATEFVVVLLPLVFLAPMTWWRWGLLVAAVLYLAAFNASVLEFGVLGGLMAAWAAWRRDWQLVAIFALAGVAGFLLVPEVARSFEMRFELWGTTLRMFAAHPLVGTGLGGFNWGYPVFAPETSVFMDPNTHAGAAHNELLQLAAELGLVGLALAGAVLVYALRGLRATPVAVALIALGLLCLVDFPLQNPATGALGAVLLAVSAPRSAAVPVARLVWPARIGATALAGLVLFAGVQEWRAHRAFGQTAIYYQADALRAFRANYEAFQIWPYDWQIRQQLYLSLRNLMARRETRVSRAALDRTYAISASASPFSPALVAMRAYEEPSG